MDRIVGRLSTVIHLCALKLRHSFHLPISCEYLNRVLKLCVSGERADKWREAYGVFCSSHNEAVAVFKDLMKSDRRFQQFIRQCSENPLLKKKGVPECILFVTTRITKYPLLIEPLIKTAKDRPADQEHLRQALDLVKVGITQHRVGIHNEESKFFK